MDNIVCIYKITNTVTGDFYIGQTINFHERQLQHKRNPPPKMREDVEKYGWDAFKFEILEECDRENLTEKERDYIKSLKPAYNIHPFDYTITEETRRKRSQSLLGHTVSATTRAKLRKFHLGRRHTKASREKMSKSRKGHPVSLATRQKISKANSGKKHNYVNGEKSVICIETNMEFKSLKRAALHYGIKAASISAVLRGRQKTAGGFHWKYTEESANKKISAKISENATNKKAVICMDTGEVFQSMRDAARKLNISYASICHALRGEQVLASGYYIRFVDESLNTKVRTPDSMIDCRVPVVCIETDEVFPSVTTAAKSVGVSNANIRGAIKGGTKAGGFHWKYFEDKINEVDK